MVKRRKARTKARHFHDNPRIRGGRDRALINLAEPWEARYAGIKRYKPKRKKRKTAKRRTAKRRKR